MAPEVMLGRILFLDISARNHLYWSNSRRLLKRVGSEEEMGLSMTPEKGRLGLVDQNVGGLIEAGDGAVNIVKLDLVNWTRLHFDSFLLFYDFLSAFEMSDRTSMIRMMTRPTCSGLV